MDGMDTNPVKLTHEEHHARAMLLGMWYADRCHMYINTRQGQSLDSLEPARKTIRLDADTLKPISSMTAYKRYEQWKQENRG